MTETERITELERLCGELTQRLWAFEKWALAHEVEQWQHRMYLEKRGSNAREYGQACSRKYIALLNAIPSAKHEPMLDA